MKAKNNPVEGKALPNRRKGISKKKKIWIGIGICVILVAVYFGFNRGKNQTELVIVGTEGTAQMRDITSSVTGSAVVMPTGALDSKTSKEVLDFLMEESRSNGVNMGLGLSMVKWIVEHHKGTISVQSTEGQGTEFTVQIPVEQE